ncbi:unnamed protein product [Brassica rapa]|uniref:SLC26A/SulP transporter domain-containing protein n=2 Tax=Brassica TaxID=3705 RepID=A0A8D9HU42_BRACM|nr:unnamed protein product [Brassica napus]CAG7905913.1 unnamed protein product [Brassica rapa]
MIQSTKKPKFFWVAAMAPLTSVILGSLLVYLTHAERHGVQVIGNLKKGLNPLSISDLRSRLYFALHADSSQNWPHYWDHSSRCKFNTKHSFVHSGENAIIRV